MLGWWDRIKASVKEFYKADIQNGASEYEQVCDCGHASVSFSKCANSHLICKICFQKNENKCYICVGEKNNVKTSG